MKKLLFALLVFSLFSCKKEPINEPAKLPCELENWGGVKFINNNNYNLDVYMDGNYQKRIKPNTSEVIGGITPKTYQIKGIQVDGFIFYPDEYSLQAKIDQCKTLSISF